MARTEARIFTSIWKDEDFLALPASPQRLYMFLLSQEDLTYCGAMPLRISRWVRKAAGLTGADIEQDIKVLETSGRQFVITDEETGELLIRSFMRNDEVWKQPNLMKAARSAAAQVESPAIRAAILAELHRIPAGASSSRLVRDVHSAFVMDLSDPSANPSGNPPGYPSGGPSADVSAGQGNPDEPAGNPSGKGSANPSAKASADPSPKGSANPSQEKGDGYCSNQGDLLNSVPPEPLPSGRAKKGSRNPSANPSEPNIADVVAAYIDGATDAGLDRPGSSLIARVGKQARQLLGEGKDIQKLITAARTMGAGEWNDLAVQLRKDDAAANGKNPGGHQTYRNLTDQSAYDTEDSSPVMISTEALAAWREEFLAEFSIERDALDESLQYESESQIGRPDSAVRTAGLSTEDRIPQRYAGALAENPELRTWMAELTRAALDSRRVVVSVTTGPSLLLLGITGTGKTHEAYGMVRGMTTLGVRSRWRFTTAADLYAKLRPRHGVDSEAVFDEHASASLLVVDDLGAAKPSEWIEEVNFRLVNHRYERMLPTLFTSNLSPRPLADVLGERVSSRLAEMTDRVTLKGTDRRYAA